MARGRWGEDLAADAYRRDGYLVVERNWRATSGEIDLIVQRPGVVVFVEVKARADARFGGPAAAVGISKQRRLRALAAQFLATHPQVRGAVRFDVVAITGVRIERLEAAF